jgi:hypothetical protein
LVGIIHVLIVVGESCVLRSRRLLPCEIIGFLRRTSEIFWLGVIVGVGVGVGVVSVLRCVCVHVCDA